MEDLLACARQLLRHAAHIAVLSGAGISAESGVPTFRDAQTGLWAQFNPQDLATESAFRAHPQRVWDWYQFRREAIARVQPNAGHLALARFAQRQPGRLSLITQNVDGLHQRAGSREVIDLHGRLDRVVCLACGEATPREALQARMTDANPGWRAQASAAAPDGDADIDAAAVARFLPPWCATCGGPLKPDVVFFGENVPRERYARAVAALEAADAMLAVGTSLMVYSGFRFARIARERGLPLAILNRGRTRADDLATLRLDGDCGAMLSGAMLAAALPR